MLNSSLNNPVIEHLNNSSILCLNGYWNNINKKCACHPGYKLEKYNNCTLIPKLNKVKHLRNMLSNETLSNAVKEESYDFLIIIISLIVIICGLLVITYLYKKWKRMTKTKNEEENEDNESSEQARCEFEKNYLNSKTFSFIPLSSPIKLRDIKDIKTQEPEINIDEKNSNNKNNAKLRIEEPRNIKKDNISSFGINCGNDKIIVKKRN